MSASLVSKYCNSVFIKKNEQLPSEKFYESLMDLDKIIGLDPHALNTFYRIFLDANRVEEFSTDEKREKFARRFTNYLAVKGGRTPILERSCFRQVPIPKVQRTLDLVHYFCLRIFDEIFEIRNEPLLEWVDLLFDKDKITYSQAALIPELVERANFSLIEYDYDESDLALLLRNNPHKELTAQFAAELSSLKCRFPIKDAEIALFTEVANAIFYMKGNVAQRGLFREFLERFLENLEKYNSGIKKPSVRLYFYPLEKKSEESPAMVLGEKKVPRIKLEANRYWFLRKFDEIMDSRSNFAKCVDDLYDQGYLTFSAANSFLSLAEENREWNKFNFTQQLLRILERHRLEIDMKILLHAVFPPDSPVR